MSIRAYAGEENFPVPPGSESDMTEISENGPKFPRPARRGKVRRGSEAPLSIEDLALAAARSGIDRKASNVTILDVRQHVDYADYLVVMTGGSDRNVAAIAQGVESDLAQHGHRVSGVEGLPEANWVLVDFIDVIVHVFQEEHRYMYDLDGLWTDAPRVAIPKQD